ncbi:hypothetical protein BUALT_Bualt14G0055500 [Buddleja alternifolia]|uniref:EF-hand domain-containing protein n=1 Tax=Buddleja alternifolia TaxID=168488 RepID=A0AAV6WS94_9LAMI|nr:hypothetical protein BUALT_Bualt14G0055500 [Buddleja alternifolia]
MAVVVIAFHLTLLIFLIGNVEGRFLRLNSSDQDHLLISDGVEKQTSACNHQYNFLPCAENAAGYIFQIVVYQGLLIFGEKQRDKGSMMLSHILGVGKFGGIIFGILAVLPSMMLMIVSGVFTSKENAQSQVSVGVGIYAGITVFSLTVQWGICVISGRKNLLHKPNDDDDHPQETSHSNCFLAKEKVLILKDTGVEIDRRTRYMGGFMLLSLIPYIIVQIVDIFHTWSGTETDKDADKCITKGEVESLVLKIVGAGKMQVDTRSAVSDVMGTFNFNDDASITEEEFVNGCKIWIDEANQSPESSDSSSRNIIHEAS